MTKTDQKIMEEFWEKFLYPLVVKYEEGWGTENALPELEQFILKALAQVREDTIEEVSKSMEAVLKRNGISDFKYLIDRVQNSMNNKLKTEGKDD